MQLCELQRTEDFEVVFEDDVEGGPSVPETEASVERAEEDEGAGLEGESAGDDHDAPDVRGSADKRGDTTESSDGGTDVGEGSSSDGTESDSAAYKDSDLERDAPPPVSSPRGKSSTPDATEQAGSSVCVVVDLSSSSDPDSEGSSSVPASKPAPSFRRTKELEAAARKAQAAPSKQVLKERRWKTTADVDAGAVPINGQAHL